ncbi:unnamed protein product [Anisakis simplex]|uniref:Uncharacterized protein n=1 Tax=Anisakis simplex TaxID=6269 RepID=A0A3P6QCZ1_ANISI|nr:unnamed protein product [Anisakis simplex]
MNAQSIYHLRRRLRHARNARAASRLQMLLGALGYFKQRFDFQLKLLLTVCDCKSTKSDKIAKICCCVEDALTEYMREVL